MTVLRIFNLVEIVIVSVYFNYSIPFFHKRNIGIYIASFSLLLGIGEMYLFRSLINLNGFFMYYEGTIIISMALFSMFRLVKDHPYLIVTTIPHFWFATVQILFWSFTILNWTFYDYVNTHATSYKPSISYALCFINYLCYLIVAGTFLFYPKTHKENVGPIYN